MVRSGTMEYQECIKARMCLQSGYLGGLRSSLGGWTQKVKSWYWGRPLVSFRPSALLRMRPPRLGTIIIHFTLSCDWCSPFLTLTVPTGRAVLHRSRKAFVVDTLMNVYFSINRLTKKYHIYILIQLNYVITKLKKKEVRSTVVFYYMRIKNGIGRIIYTVLRFCLVSSPLSYKLTRTGSQKHGFYLAYRKDIKTDIQRNWF